jgi:hypothetical protein
VPVVDGFRRGLGSAIQWLDCLKVMVDRRVDQRLQGAYELTQQVLESEASVSSPLPSKQADCSSAAVETPRTEGPSPTPQDTSTSVYTKYSGQYNVTLPSQNGLLASRYLQSRCPACFGGTVWGRTQAEWVLSLLSFILILIVVIGEETYMWESMETSIIAMPWLPEMVLPS